MSVLAAAQFPLISVWNSARVLNDSTVRRQIDRNVVFACTASRHHPWHPSYAQQRAVERTGPTHAKQLHWGNVLRRCVASAAPVAGNDRYPHLTRRERSAEPLFDPCEYGLCGFGDMNVQAPAGELLADLVTCPQFMYQPL